MRKNYLRNILSFIITLSFLMVYMPVGVFAADAPVVTVNASTSDINEDSAVIKVSLESDADVKFAGGTITWSTSPNPGNAYLSDDMDSPTYTIDGLNPDTTYDYSVEIDFSYIVDVVGEDEDGLEIFTPTKFFGTAHGSGSFTTEPAATLETLKSPTITITAPVTGASPATSLSIASKEGYTGTIVSWHIEPSGTRHYGKFLAKEIYSVDVQLTAKSGYQWPDTFPTINLSGGGTVVSNTRYTDGTHFTFSVIFPETKDDAPSVTTDYISSSDINVDNATVTIDITSLGSGITSHGIVWSKTSKENSLKVGASGADSTSSSSSLSTGQKTHSMTNLSPNTTYYVRGFTYNSTGKIYTYDTSWEEVRTLRASYLAAAKTESATRISNTSIDVEISVANPTQSGESSAKSTERGVVYSRSNKEPVLKGTDVSSKKASGTGSGNASVSLTGLSSGSDYYVRAYSENKYGTSYGDVIHVTTQNYVTTNAIKTFTATSAELGGTVLSNINNKVLERGVVYSKTNTSPVITDMSKKSDVTASGSYTVTVTGLEVNTKYYVRAYVRTLDGYSYGNVVNFTTGTSIPVTLTYKTSDGWRVNKQIINSAVGSVITEDSLNIPNGYALTKTTFSYTVTSRAAADVTVKKVSQGAYMEGTSNYRFEPERNITRIEVAKMVHALRGYSYAGEGLSFRDMPNNSAELAALKYVTAMGFMEGDSGAGGSFRPYSTITRAEVVKILCTVYELSTSNQSHPFSDVGNHWGRGYIAAGYRNNMLQGYPDGTFKPEANMTKAEAAAVFARAEKLNLIPIGYSPFIDVPTVHWAYDYIMNAALPRA